MADETELILDDRIKTLKGDVRPSTIFLLNNRHVQTKDKMNVYVQNDCFQADLKTKNISYTDPEQFVKYLIESDLIKIVKKPNRPLKAHSKRLVYKTFPFSPTFKEIIVGLQKILFKLSPLEILKLSTEDVALYSMLGLLGIEFSYEQGSDFYTNFVQTVTRAKGALRAKEDQWLIDNGLPLPFTFQ